MSSEEIDRLNNIAKIAQKTLPKYEIRGLFKLVEDTPAGIKCGYLELEVDVMIMDRLYGGVLLATPKESRKTGFTALEISTRNNKIIVYPNASSRDAMILRDAYKSNMREVYTIDIN